VRPVIHTLAMSVLLVASAVGLRTLGTIAVDAAGPRLSQQARDLCWRLLAVKLAALTISVMAIAGA
jgi:hypothetical protein